MIFEFDIINYKSIKKRLLTKKIENNKFIKSNFQTLYIFIQCFIFNYYKKNFKIFCSNKKNDLFESIILNKNFE